MLPSYALALLSPSINQHCSQPSQVSTFSKDADGTHIPALPSALRRFRDPKIGSNLGEGFQSFVPKRDSVDASSLHPVLQAMSHGGVSEGVHFVSFRNNLNKVCCLYPPELACQVLHHKLLSFQQPAKPPSNQHQHRHQPDGRSWRPHTTTATSGALTFIA